MGEAPRPFACALTGAAIAAAVAFVLALPLIGFRLIDQVGGEGFTTRWPWLMGVVALVFVARLVVWWMAGSIDLQTLTRDTLSP